MGRICIYDPLVNSLLGRWAVNNVVDRRKHASVILKGFLNMALWHFVTSTKS